MQAEGKGGSMGSLPRSMSQQGQSMDHALLNAGSDDLCRQRERGAIALVQQQGTVQGQEACRSHLATLCTSC